MNKIRAVCTDIDGTLLDSRRELSPRTIAAFKKINKDIPVILASSRMPSAMRHLQAELGILHYPLICFNGGYVVHYNGAATPNVIDTVVIEPSLCSAIAAHVKGTTIHMSLYHDDNWYAPKEDAWSEKETRVTKVMPVFKEFEAVLQDWTEHNYGAHKVMCMGPQEEIQVLDENLRKTLSDKIHIYRSSPTYVEIAPRSISKATALRLLLSSCYSIDMANVIAFGDNYNDVEMIQAVGIGVAVGNARDEVKAVAKEITSGNKEDGVAITLEKYF
ncbi:MAG TPA: HAD family hydrolase [Cyclobacteriaceae bacterium]